MNADEEVGMPYISGMMCAKETFIILEGEPWKRAGVVPLTLVNYFLVFKKDLKQINCMYICGGVYMGAQCLRRSGDGIRSTKAEVLNLPNAMAL